MNHPDIQVLDAESRIAQDFAKVYLPMAHRWVQEAQSGFPLHLPQEQKHDHPGWMSALSLGQLARAGIPISQEDLEFEVPLDCPWWHEAERLPDGRVFRFFAERAWLKLPAEYAQRQLVFYAMFAIDPHALWELEIHADGKAMRRVSAVDYGHGLYELVFERMSNDFVSRIDFITSVSAVVSKQYMGSNDHRYLSLAVTQPRWSFACRR